MSRQYFSSMHPFFKKLKILDFMMIFRKDQGKSIHWVRVTVKRWSFHILTLFDFLNPKMMLTCPGDVEKKTPNHQSHLPITPQYHPAAKPRDEWKTWAFLALPYLDCCHFGGNFGNQGFWVGKKKTIQMVLWKWRNNYKKQETNLT